MRLTDIGIRSLPIPERGQKIHWDDLTGFGVRVSQGGTKTYVLMHGRNRELTTIGRVGVIELKEARIRAKEILAERTLGKTRPQTIAFDDAVALFLAEKGKVCRASTVLSYKRRLSHFRFKDRLAAFGHADFSRALARVRTPSERDHALVAAKVFCNWAIKRRYIAEDPTLGYSQTSRPARSRVLSDDELGRVWIAAGKIDGTFGTIVKLLILTGQRRGEITALHSSWLDRNQKTITLPSDITKNRREHKFPVGAFTISLVPDSRSAPLFPARGNDNAYFSGWSKSKVQLDKISGVTNWTLHDIRRTVASNLAALGVQLPVIERLLNHVSGSFGGIVAVYQRHSFMNEMREGIERWERRVVEIGEVSDFRH